MHNAESCKLGQDLFTHAHAPAPICSLIMPESFGTLSHYVNMMNARVAWNEGVDGQLTKEYSPSRHFTESDTSV